MSKYIIEICDIDDEAVYVKTAVEGETEESTAILLGETTARLIDGLVKSAGATTKIGEFQA